MEIFRGIFNRSIKIFSILLISVSAAAHSTPIEKNVLYSQGQSAGQMEFYIDARNCPINTELGFQADTPLPGRRLVLPPSKVLNPQSAIYKLIADIPANWVGNITDYYDLHGKTKGKCLRNRI